MGLLYFFHKALMYNSKGLQLLFVWFFWYRMWIAVHYLWITMV